MKVVGLITEYNPFHNGHLYHIQQSRKITGADYVVVVMSGNFVQRGAPAITDKYTRTKMALTCGADLVIELPVCYAVQSAEAFAYGAVSILDSLGFVDYLCFGSECGDITLLSELAEILLNESEDMALLINQLTKTGMSYPTARMEALLKQFKEEKRNALTSVLSSSNNILGIEYLKALKKRNSSIQPVTINRIHNSYGDEALNETGINSATSLRSSYKNNGSLIHLKESIPVAVFELLSKTEHQTFPVFENDCSDLLYFSLLKETTESLIDYIDISRDLAQRIENHLSSFTNFSDFSMLIKTKQYTLTRISRALCHVFLDIKENTTPSEPPYIRILGIKKESSHLIRRSNTEPAVPMITKVADGKTLLDINALSTLNQDIYAANLYNRIVFSKYQTRIPDEYHHGIVILE
jgi:Predicted nucleotidyltransferase